VTKERFERYLDPHRKAKYRKLLEEGAEGLIIEFDNGCPNCTKKGDSLRIGTVKKKIADSPDG
jgi:hypothetical protein